WAARTTLVNDPADLPTFDRVFRRLAAASLDDERLPVPPAQDEPAEATAASDRPGGAQPSPVGEELATAGLIASERERLRHRRFDRASDEELAAIDAILKRLPVAVPHRTSRRTRPGRRGQLDLGRSLERALTTDGELIERAWRQRTTTPRRLVVLLDVSGSMAPYARASLRFAVAARRAADRDAAHRVEVFAFGTRLTRLSDHLAARDPDAAIATAAARVVDWDGGTRIGASLDELVRVWGRRGVLRGAVAVIVSDGLERGDPAQLGHAVARLRRQLYRLVWVNPLAGDERYQPTQRGMAAALPYVDRFLPGHDLASLESLSEVLAALR
ncbi:MAG: vWA domain-containing protein, partial [Nitriliruptoraceae bacterium]